MKIHHLLLVILISGCTSLIATGLESASEVGSNALDLRIMKDKYGEVSITSFTFQKNDSLSTKSITLKGELFIKGGTKFNQVFYDLSNVEFVFKSMNGENKVVRQDLVQLSIVGNNSASLPVNASYPFVVEIFNVPENQIAVISGVKFVACNQYGEFH